MNNIESTSNVCYFSINKSQSYDFPLRIPKDYLQKIRKYKTFDLNEFKKINS